MYNIVHIIKYHILENDINFIDLINIYNNNAILNFLMYSVIKS
jgi:hypothetical protein